MPSKKYIVFLRGINVGGRNKIKMDQLKSVFSNMGFEDVVSYIQSGNIIFNCDNKNNYDCKNLFELEKLISSKLEDEFQFRIPVLIKAKEDLIEIIENNPFKNNSNIKNQHFTMTGKNISENRIEELYNYKENLNKTGKNPNNDEFIIINNTIYLLCPNGYHKTKFHNNFFEKKLAISCTSRNLRTINKMIELSS